MRIVSLLPSATEMVCALGLEDRLVGVTHECDWPPSVRSLPKVTQTHIPTDVSSREIDSLVRERLGAGNALYSLDLPALEALAPDLLITQALCSVCAVAEEEVTMAACSLPGSPRVLNLEPSSLAEVLDCMVQVGVAAGIETQASRVVQELRARVDAVAARSSFVQHAPRVLLVEWIDPLFSSGHWSPELVRLAGGIEGIGVEGTRSREFEWEEALRWRPEVMVIACCGMSIERTMAELPIVQSLDGFEELPCARENRVYVVDGAAYFSRPGPRLVEALELLAHLLHPTIHPRPAGAEFALVPAAAA